MAGKWTVLAAAVVAALLTGVASAATNDAALDASKVGLQASDFPGSHASGTAIPGDAVTTGGFLRLIALPHPYGASGYRAILSLSLVAKDPSTATKLYATVGHRLSERSGRVSLIKSFLKGAGQKTKLSQVRMIRPRALGVPDSSMEIGFVVIAQGKRLNLSVSLIRVDRVIDENIAIGAGKTISLADGTAITKLAAGHILGVLVPGPLELPQIFGSAVQGQVLTGSTGSWANTPKTFGYQWERCDAGGLNCAAIEGATTSTYQVTAADAGATLRVVVSGSNRFGAASATSVQTAVVT